VFSLTLLLACGCSEPPRPWREQTLPSGRVVKVAAFYLALGLEHDERLPGHDCFGLEFVFGRAAAEPDEREQEAKEVFELIRPISEQWGFATATLTAFATPERARHFDFFVFRRAPDGLWSCQREQH
jgi:hypothetical protein